MDYNAFMGGINTGMDTSNKANKQVTDAEDRAIKLKKDAEDRAIAIQKGQAEANLKTYDAQATGALLESSDAQAKIVEQEKKIKDLSSQIDKVSSQTMQSDIIDQVLAKDSRANLESFNTKWANNSLAQKFFGDEPIKMPSKDSYEDRKAMGNYIASLGGVVSETAINTAMDSGMFYTGQDGSITDVTKLMAGIGTHKYMSPTQKSEFEKLAGTTNDAIMGNKETSDKDMNPEAGKEQKSQTTLDTEQKARDTELDTAKQDATKTTQEVTKPIVDEMTQAEAELARQKAKILTPEQESTYRDVAGLKSPTTTSETALKTEVNLTKQLVGEKKAGETDEQYHDRFLSKYKEIRQANDSPAQGHNPESVALMGIISNPNSSPEEVATARALLKKKGYIAPQSVASQSDIQSSVVTDRDVNGVETSYVVNRSKSTGDIISKEPIGKKAPKLSQSDVTAVDSMNAWQDNKKALEKVLNPKYKTLFGPIDSALAKGAELTGMELETNKKLAEVKAAASGAMITMMGTMKGNLSEGERNVLQALVPQPSDTYQTVQTKVKQFKERTETIMKAQAKRINKSNAGVIDVGALKPPPSMVPAKPTGEVVQNGWVYSADGKPLRKAK